MLNLIRTMTVVSIRIKQILCILLLYHEIPYFSMKLVYLVISIQKNIIVQIFI